MRISDAPPISGFLRQQSGSAMIEFAAFLCIFVLLLSGIVDYSLYIQREMELQQAAAAGAAYGAIPGNQKDLTGMQNAATATAPDVTGLSVVAANVYTCTPGGTPVTNLTICSGTTPIMYVQINTSATVPAVLRWAGISSSLQLSGFAIYRVPWTK